MKGIIAYFIKYPIAANLLMIGIFALGVFGMTNMASTFFPESESRFISVQAVYPGASPEEIEEGIVLKIEENLKGVTGVERVTSVSSENLGSVSVEIAKGYNIDLVLTDVKNAVDQINSFPAAMEPPTIFKQENLSFVISFSLSGDVSLRTLKEFGRQVEDDLRAMEGISKVNLSGFPEEEIEIAFREQDLQAYQLTFQQATQAVRVANIELTGGTIKGEKEELLIRAKNKNFYADELRDIVVKNTPNGGIVRLHQVADVRDRWEDNPTRSYLNGEPAVIITIQNTLEENALDISALAKEYIDEFNAKNDVIKATIIRDQALYLTQRIGLLTENGLMGFGIVLVLLALFLHWRLAFWVALSIPISFAGMFIFAYLLGVTINVVSLFGMILVIGILVDDGIVISESIYQEYTKGLPPVEAAVEGTMKVFPAVVGAILTTMIAFSGFYFVDGRFGDFFSAISTIVIFSLLFSLIEGAFILPTHIAHSKALTKEGSKKHIILQRVEDWFDRVKNNIYAPTLNFALRNKAVVIAAITSLLLATIGAVQGGIIQSTFFPNIEFDNSLIRLKLAAGTNEDVTREWIDKIESAVQEVNEELKETYENGERDLILNIEKAIGPTTYQGQVNLTILDAETRNDSLSVSDINNAIRRKIGPIPSAENFSIGAAGAFGKPVSITLSGENLNELMTATEVLKDSLRAINELTEIGDDNQEGLREVNIKLNEKAHYLGLNLQDVVTQVRQGFFGSEIQRLQRGRDEVRVWVRYRESERSNIGQLENMRIRFADGREFPLSEIADFEIERGVIAINHIDGKRGITIDANLATVSASAQDINQNVQDSILPKILRNYPTVTTSVEGEARESARSFSSMAFVFPIALLLMFFVIALTFRSIGQTIVVAVLIPFGLIGVGWGHYIMDFQLSMSSNLGVFALIGVLVNDTLVFITTYNQMLGSGMPQMQAVKEAGLSRFRPIVLTSLTTIAGLLPLMFEKSVQAQFLIPMAISVAFGLMLITVIILILLPVLLVIINRIRVYSLFAWEGQKPSYEMVEPAISGRRTNYGVWLIGALLMAAVFAGALTLMFRLTGMMF